MFSVWCTELKLEPLGGKMGGVGPDGRSMQVQGQGIENIKEKVDKSKKVKEFQTLNTFYKVRAELLEGSTQGLPRFDDPCPQMLAFHSHGSLFED